MAEREREPRSPKEEVGLPLYPYEVLGRVMLLFGSVWFGSGQKIH